MAESVTPWAQPLLILDVLKHHGTKPPRPQTGRIHGKPLDVHTGQQSPEALPLIP